MHALGLEHEHQRPDRDMFIKIQEQNVDPENFEKISHDDVDLYHDYDYNSIMHYDGTAFGRLDPNLKRPMITMVPLKMGVMLTDNLNLTALDSEKLRILGKCDSSEDFEANNNIKRSNNVGLREKMSIELLSKENLEKSVSDEENEKIIKITPLCVDYAYECEKLRKRGFCENSFYKKLMIHHCKATCKFCLEEA